MGHFNPHLVRLLALLASLATSATAQAGAMPSYQVSDLGAGTASFGPSAGGRIGVVPAGGGSTYAFDYINHKLATDGPTIAALPKMTNAPTWNPMTYGNPNNAYSYILPGSVFVNDKGQLVATDVYGVAGHIAGAGSTVLTAQRQADGSFGPLTTLWGSGENLYSGGQIAIAAGMNNLGQILGITSNGSYASRDYFVYDSASGISTHLASVLPGWHIDSALGLDENGRILLLADNATGGSVHTLLLTPEGVSNDPIPVPEPTSLMVLAVGAAGILLRRRGVTRGCQSRIRSPLAA